MFSGKIASRQASKRNARFATGVARRVTVLGLAFLLAGCAFSQTYDNQDYSVARATRIFSTGFQGVFEPRSLIATHFDRAFEPQTRSLSDSENHLETQGGYPDGSAHSIESRSPFPTACAQAFELQSVDSSCFGSESEDPASVSTPRRQF